MPILANRLSAPLPSQQKHGIVFASPGDIAFKLRSLLLEFERHVQTTVNPDAFIVDRYTILGDIEVPAILAGPVPDDYTPQRKGLAFTVFSAAKTIPAGMANNINGQQWTVDVKDYSGCGIINQIMPFIRENLFPDSMFVPRYEAEENDARVPTGLLFINLYDDPRNSRNLTFIDTSSGN